MKMAQLQLENKELECEKEQLKKDLELMKATFKKTERLEVSYQRLDSENQKLQKALENSNKKIHQLESELQYLDMENHTLQKNLEELKISSERLEQLEKENKSLEQETSQLGKDKKQLEKENKRLRQQAEIKDTTLEKNNMKIGNLEKENKTLFKEIAVYKESCILLKELQKENKELMKRAAIDIKTLVTLEELLSQLKGNLEEENRHLLDQIQALMLQNRTLFEQNMESKDLFHVEQRQNINKLNELRRQKERLEEKIMDQYKFYDPSHPRRRGNWITLKMRKLRKSKKNINRKCQKSLTLTPTHSDSSEGFLQLPHQDSQDSSLVGSNSLEDGQTLGTKKSSTMNDLVQSMVLAGGQWTGSTEHLKVPDDILTGKRRKELGAMAFSTTAISFSTVNSSTGFRCKQLLNNKDTSSSEDDIECRGQKAGRIRTHIVKMTHNALENINVTGQSLKHRFQHECRRSSVSQPDVQEIHAVSEPEMDLESSNDVLRLMVLPPTPQL
ncbi:hypothetical protein MC885_000495 [Smutsia gigantea]|nr:hypothetical protein MC885_000495 [Smutsia gigantea]